MPSKPFSLDLSSLMFSGAMRTSMRASLAMRCWKSSSWVLRPSGIAKVSDPVMMSSAFIGWLVFMLMSCRGLASVASSQPVCSSLSSGSGPRSRRRTTPDSGTRAIEPMRVLRIILRRPKPDSAAPVRNCSMTSARTSSSASIG